MNHRVLAINPGSTSTKVAVYEENNCIFSTSLSHTAEELEKFPSVLDQFEWRKGMVLKALEEGGIELGSLSAVIGRGGIIDPVESGVYKVNADLIHDLIHAKMQHASNLGGLIAGEIASSIGVDAFIADPVVVDEMMPYARISGCPELPRESIFHALNQKAVARLYARECDTTYESLNLIVCHMGGGITISAHRKGKVIDTTNALDGCGPFSPERSGSLPPGPLVKLCFSGKYTEDELLKIVHGKGGLMAHLGTTSVPEILDRIDRHDLHAMLVLRAMCYTVAKEIGAMAVTMRGDVDAILLTGGMAHSKRITDFVADHVSFIAPIFVYPGENELKALAENALAAIKGEREIKIYRHQEYDDPSKSNDTRFPSKMRDILNAAVRAPKVEKSLTAIRQYLRRFSNSRH